MGCCCSTCADSRHRSRPLVPDGSDTGPVDAGEAAGPVAAAGYEVAAMTSNSDGRGDGSADRIVRLAV